MGSTFEVEPDGELFPLFRQLRFVVDLQSSGNGQWTLRAYDRTTGAERCRFGDLKPPQAYNPGAMVSAKFLQASGHLLLVHLGQWVYCLDLAEKKELWRKDLIGEGTVPNATQTQTDNNGDVEAVLRFADNSRVTIPIGKWSVLQAGYVCLVTRDGIEMVEPMTRRQLWSRRNIPDNVRVYGDARYILLVETGNDRKPISTKLFRAVDGMTVAGAPDAGRVLADANSYQIFGRTVLLSEGSGNQARVLRLHDLATGKDLWRKEYDPKGVPVRALDPEWTGFVTADGAVEVLSTQTGKAVGTFQIDPDRVGDHLKDCAEAQLLADADRFYVVLDRDERVGRPGGARVQRLTNVLSLRSFPVNGPMYCFDRTSGKRLWYVEDVLEHQAIILDRFADLPVVIAAAPVVDRNGSTYRVVVIEKERGMLRFNSGIPNINGWYFQSMNVDLKNGIVEVYRPDMRIQIRPEDEK